MHSVLEFWTTFFHTFDVTTEVVMIILIAVMLVIIGFSKPKKTYMMKHLLLGIFLALAIMMLHIGLLAETIAMRQTHSMQIFNAIYIIYAICYVLELGIIFVYQTQLSYKRRMQQMQVAIMAIVFIVIWTAIMFLPLLQNKLLIYEDGIYTLSIYSNSYVLCSFLCAVIAVGVTVANRNDVSRIVYWGSIIFVPLEFLGILSQLYFKTAYFVCATYTLPFLIYYILFHASTYDEITGCQGYESERMLLTRYFKSKKNFLQISIKMPKLEDRELAEVGDMMVYAYNSFCRALEKENRRIRIYGIGRYEFRMLCPVRNEKDFQRVEQQVIKILEQPLVKDGKEHKTPLNILIARRFDVIENADEQIALLHIKKKQFENANRNQILYLTEEDANKYKKDVIIEKNLLDIKNKNNLDDDRVLVYVQPIYDIASGTFRTGEALMRMQIEGKMIFPDEFIPLAEKLNCIHMLTKIMLYKVAKQTVQMDTTFDYDAITVNASTMEMTDPNASAKFIDIIKSVGADPNKIRIEITESTTITDYQTIIGNIRNMNKHGLHFYLDDFGTGYSNLDRLISIPFKTIKFDKSLLYKALEDKKSEELFLLLLKFFKSNGFATVVEGVEDEAQRDYVKKAGFDYIQGYYFSKPVPAKESLDFFEKR